MSWQRKDGDARVGGWRWRMGTPLPRFHLRPSLCLLAHISFYSELQRKSLKAKQLSFYEAHLGGAAGSQLPKYLTDWKWGIPQTEMFPGFFRAVCFFGFRTQSRSQSVRFWSTVSAAAASLFFLFQLHLTVRLIRRCSGCTGTLAVDIFSALMEILMPAVICWMIDAELCCSAFINHWSNRKIQVRKSFNTRSKEKLLLYV